MYIKSAYNTYREVLVVQYCGLSWTYYCSGDVTDVRTYNGKSMDMISN
jgi:hypothetical protein